MKTIGMIGGMSWESTRVYYEIMNRRTKALLGGYHSCQCLLYSVDFDEIERLQRSEDWEELCGQMADIAYKLEKAGADLLILCTNTMHFCSDSIISRIRIPFLHIAEATGEAITARQLKKVLLLGTKFTMQKEFYKKRLSNDFDIQVITPNAKDMELIHQIIYDELVHGNISSASRRKLIKIIKDASDAGAEGVILGCTELPLLIQPADIDIPLFDTTFLHATKAVDWAIGHH
jgi:aspartate racemase